MRCERIKGNRRPNAQQKLLESAALARRSERRRLAGEAPQVGGGGGGGEPRVAWVGCQWQMDGYCGRAPQGDDAVPRQAQQPEPAGEPRSDGAGDRDPHATAANRAA